MRVLVNEEITYSGKKFGPGRLIRTSTPQKFVEKYGSKVTIWHNWPKPMETVEAPDQEDTADLSSKSVEALKEIARGLDLKVSGTKDELIERIELQLNNQ